MTTIQHAQHYLRKRKMMMILPLLILPFVTMAFWALGGGKGPVATKQQGNNDNGLNLQLPNAHLKTDKGLDKMSYYEMAQSDSEKMKERMRSDPYYKLKSSVSDDSNSFNDRSDESGDNVDQSTDNEHEHEGLNASPYNKQKGANANETKVYQQLHAIHAALDNAKATSRLRSDSKFNDLGGERLTASNEPAVNNQNVDRLEKMMQSMKEPSGGGDSEMNQINAMLEKVMDIQHPDRINEKMKQYANSQKGKSFSVTKKSDQNTGFYAESNANGFENAHGAGHRNDADSTQQVLPAIEAVVAETQTLVSGATIKLRLLTDVSINGIHIPKGGFVFGKASLSGERLTVAITSIRYQNALLPVAMSVYDMDGMDGIYIPGAISREVAKQSTDNALQSVALNALDPSIGAQAASAGIETAKTFISKKVKLVRVTVKAGYRVLLKDNNNQ